MKHQEKHYWIQIFYIVKGDHILNGQDNYQRKTLEQMKNRGYFGNTSKNING